MSCANNPKGTIAQLNDEIFALPENQFNHATHLAQPTARDSTMGREVQEII
jgi:hypothetical protein